MEIRVNVLGKVAYKVAERSSDIKKPNYIHSERVFTQ